VNPVIAVGLGVWLGKETLSSHAALGGTLVVLAVVLIMRAPKNAQRRDALQPPALPASATAAASAVEP
jgi:drug/metabolite transporter (DMT)-like permease